MRLRGFSLDDFGLAMSLSKFGCRCRRARGLDLEQYVDLSAGERVFEPGQVASSFMGESNVSEPSDQSAAMDIFSRGWM